jgi:hypothetical protein
LVVLAPAALVVLALAAFVLWGLVSSYQDDREWERLQDAVVRTYEDRTAEELQRDLLGSSGSPYPLPDGVQLLGGDTHPSDVRLVFSTTEILPERCVELVFDEDGLADVFTLSCAAFRASGGKPS